MPSARWCWKIPDSDVWQPKKTRALALASPGDRPPAAHGGWRMWREKGREKWREMWREKCAMSLITLPCIDEPSV